MDRSDCQIWPLSKITDVLGYIAYHWTGERFVKKIKRLGLGAPVKDWYVNAHHSWYLLCLLEPWRQDEITSAFSEESRKYYHEKYHEVVLAHFEEQYPNAFMTWVSDEPFNARSFGDVLVEFRTEEVEKMRGNIFPDHAFGWAIITYGKRIPKKAVYVYTEEDLEGLREEIRTRAREEA
jgi:hypothetical protein